MITVHDKGDKNDNFSDYYDDDDEDDYDNNDNDYDVIDSLSRGSHLMKGEMSAKTTYQRSAKGPVSIAECSADGKFIVIENTGRKVWLPPSVTPFS